MNVQVGGANSSTDVNKARTYTWLALVAGSVMTPLPAAVDLAVNDYGVSRTLLCGAALVFVGVQHARLMRLAIRGLGRGGGRRYWQHVALVCVSLAAWTAMAADSVVPIVWAIPPGAAAGAIIVTLRVRLRWPVVIVTACVCAGLGTVTAMAADVDARELATVGALVVAAVAAAELAQVWIWDVTLEADNARRTSASLAVAEERLRFAAELHDIQGHSLQAIALQAELAERLIGRDDDAARDHLTQAAELARTALKETKAVVHGYRTTSLTTELTNAIRILDAAGIQTALHGCAEDVPATVQPLFSALIREGTTNVLRHSQANRCEIALSTSENGTSVRIANDGVLHEFDPKGSGLAGLQDRFGAAGGEVSARLSPEGEFELIGRAGGPP